MNAEIALENGRGQGYDGGGNMIGKHKGLQARVTRAYPKMHYHWCDAHCLNLCIGKACEEPLVKKVVDHVQQITIAYTYSAKRQEFFKEAINENVAAASDLGKRMKLKMLCVTRWSARHDAFSSVKDGIKPLVTSLEKLLVANDEKANGLLTVILQFYFIVVLVIVSSVLGVTAILSKKLQYESLDLNDAADYAKVCKTQLEDLTQNQAHFDKLYEEACNIAHDLEIEASWPREMRRRPQQLTLFTSLADFFNKTVFLPFIESMLHQIETRLVHSEPHFRATWLLPSKLDFLLSDAELIDKLIRGIFSPGLPYYEDCCTQGCIHTVEQELQHWITRWKNTHTSQRTKQILDSLNSTNMDFYPNIKVVLIHFLTLPVTTASVERCFSVMRRL